MSQIPDDIFEMYAKSASPSGDKRSRERAAIEKGARELGIDPIDYATAMSYESAGTFDPWQAGPVTKWGQHRGTIQYGEPQQKQYGVYQGQSFEDQVTNSNVKYLREAGVKPGATFEQIYAAINGGSAAKNLNTKDWDTGRTISDNISNALREHRPKVLARYGWEDKPVESFRSFDDVFAAYGGGQISASAQPYDIEDILGQYGKSQGSPTPTNPSQQPLTTGLPPEMKAPLPETPKTLDIQRESVADPASPKAAVLFTPGETPSMDQFDPKEYGAFPTKQGTLVVNLAKAKKLKLKTPDDIQTFLDKNPNGMSRLIGKAENVEDTTKGAAVLTTMPDGTEAVASAVSTPEVAEQQIKIDAAAFPGSTSKIVDAQDVVQHRISASKNPTPLADKTNTQQQANEADIARQDAEVENARLNAETRQAEAVDPTEEGNAIAETVQMQPGMDGKVAARAVLQQIAPKYGIDVEKVLRENPNLEIVGRNDKVDVTYGDLQGFLGNSGVLDTAKAEQRVNAPEPVATKTPDEPNSVINRLRGISPEQEAEENKKADPLYAEAQKNIAEYGGNEQDVEAEYLRLKSNEKLRREESLNYGKSQGEQYNAAESGFVGAGGRGASSIAGALDVFKTLNPHLKPLWDAADGDKLTEMARNTGLAMQQAEATEAGKNTDIWSTVVRTGASVPGDISRLAVMSRLPGGSVVTFGADAGLQSIGRGNDTGEVFKDTAKGAAMGLLFHGAGKWVAPKVEQAIGSRLGLSKETMELVNKGALEAPFKGTPEAADAALNVARRAFISKIGGETARVGSIGGGTYALAAATGSENPGSEAVMMMLTDLALSGSRFGDLAKLSKQVWRVPAGETNAKPRDYMLLSEGGDKLAVYDVTSKMPKESVTGVITRDVPGTDVDRSAFESRPMDGQVVRPMPESSTKVTLETDKATLDKTADTSIKTPNIDVSGTNGDAVDISKKLKNETQKQKPLTNEIQQAEIQPLKPQMEQDALVSDKSVEVPPSAPVTDKTVTADSPSANAAEVTKNAIAAESSSEKPTAQSKAAEPVSIEDSPIIAKEGKFSGSLEIPRAEMPQISGDDFTEFKDFAKEKGVEIKPEQVQAKTLKPTQRSYNPEHSASLPEEALDKPLTVSSDNRVLDGHNRLVRLLENGERTVTINRLPLTAEKALSLMKEFPKTTYKLLNQVGNGKPESAEKPTSAEVEKPEQNEQANEITAFVKKSIADPAKSEKYVVQNASAETRTKIEKALGVPMSERYRHIITGEGIRHALKRHGNDAKEVARGQEAITADDFAKIPEIVTAPDTVEKGKDTRTGLNTLVYSKRFNGSTFYVESVRHGKEELATTTLYKRKAPRTPNPDAQDVSPVKPERVDAALDAKKDYSTPVKPDGYMNYRPVKVLGIGVGTKKVKFLDTGEEKTVRRKFDRTIPTTEITNHTKSAARSLFGLQTDADDGAKFGIKPIESENKEVLYSVPRHAGKTFEKRLVMIQELLQRDRDLREYIANNNPDEGRQVTQPIVIGIKRDGVVLDGMKRIAQAISNGHLTIQAYVQSGEKSLLSVAAERNSDDISKLKNLAEAQDFRQIVPKIASSLDENTLSLDSPEAVETVRTLLALGAKKARNSIPVLEGAFLKPTNVTDLMEATNAFAETAEEAGIDSKPLRDLITHLDNALELKRGVKIRVFDSAKPHEDIHEGSFVGSDGVEFEKRYARSEEMKTHPAFQKFHAELNKIQGPSSHGVALEESLAYLGSGDHERFGLSDDEAADVLGHLVERYAEANGAEALANFQPSTKLYEAIDQFRKSSSGKTSDVNRKPVDKGRQARSTTPAKKPEDDVAGKEEPEKQTHLKAGDRVKDSYGRKGTVFADKAGELHIEQDGTKARLPVTPTWKKTPQQVKLDRKARKGGKYDDSLGDPDEVFPPDPLGDQFDGLDEHEAHAMAMKNIRFALESEAVKGYEKSKVSHEKVKSVYEEILKRLGRPTPIRYGRLGVKARGVYKPHSEVIRLKEAGNVPTASHEVFHAIQKVVFGQAKSEALDPIPTKAVRELVTLGKLLYKGHAKPSGGYATEGFAEFGRHYLTLDNAAEVAPNMYRYFENEFLPNNPDLADALKDAREITDAYRKQGALNRAESSMSRLTLRKRLNQALGNLQKNFSTLMVDELSPLLRFTKEVETQSGIVLEAGKNPGMIASFLRGNSAPVVHYMATDGMIDAARNKVGPPLTDALSIVKGKQWEFEQYLRARRSIERWRQDKNPGLALEDAETIVKAFDSPEFQLAAEKYYEWNRGVFNYVRGLVPDMAEILDRVEEASYDYVPLMREMSEDGQTLAGKYAGIGKNPIQLMKGSGRRIKPIFPQVIANAERMVSLAHKRKVLDSIARLEEIEGIGNLLERVPRDKVPMAVSIAEIEKALKDAGADLKDVDLDQAITFFMPAQAPKGQDPILPIMRDGQVIWYQVPADLYNALSGMDLYRMGKVADLLLGAPARAFRLGSTGLRASFSLVTNPLRDVQTVFMQTQAKNPAKLMWNLVKAFGSAVNPKRLAGKNSESLDAFYRLGINLAQPLGVDEAATTKFSKHLFHSMPRKVVSSPINTLRELLSVTESIPRVAEMTTIGKEIGWEPGDTLTFDQAVQLGLAGKQATVDFSAAGKAGKVFNQAVPFFNANIQGSRSFGRAMKRHPLATVLKGLTAVTIPTLLLWWKNKDKDWYVDMPDREKNIYWNMEANGQIIQIPRGQEVGGLFATLPESIADSWYRKDPAGFEASMGFLFDLATPPMLPVPAKAAQEQWMNQIVYFERPIVPKAEEDLPANEQYGQFTSEVAKWLGRNLPDAKIAGIPINSPRRIDAAIRTFGGGVAADVTQVTNTKSPNDWEPSDYPVVGRLFRRGGTLGSGSKAIDKFYDELEMARKREASKENPETNAETMYKAQLEDAAKALGALRRVSSGVDAAKRREITQMSRDIASRVLRGESPFNPNPPKDEEKLANAKQKRDAKLLSRYVEGQDFINLPADAKRDIVAQMLSLPKNERSAKTEEMLKNALKLGEIEAKDLASIRAAINSEKSPTMMQLDDADGDEFINILHRAMRSANDEDRKKLMMRTKQKWAGATSAANKEKYKAALDRYSQN